MSDIEREIADKLAEQGLVDTSEDLESQYEESSLEVEESPVDLSSIPEEDRKYAEGFNPNGEKSLEQYVHDGKFIETISRVSKENKELKATLNEIKDHMSKQQQLGYQKALKELQEEREAAIALGDIQTVNDVEAKISAQQQELQNKADSQQTLHPVAQDFVSRHSKWLNDPSYEAQQVREFVQRRDNELAAFGLDPEKHIATLEKDLSVAFPQHFGDQKASSVGVQAVESDVMRTAPQRKAKYTVADLNPDQKQCLRHFERQGVMSKEEYIKQLVELGELR